MVTSNMLNYAGTSFSNLTFTFAEYKNNALMKSVPPKAQGDLATQVLLQHKDLPVFVRGGDTTEYINMNYQFSDS